MRLMLYGIGKGSEYVETCIKKEHSIIGYTDSNSQISLFKGKRFYKIDDIIDVVFDKLIITIQNRDVANEILKKLINIGIDKEKIIPFFMCAETQMHLIKLQQRHFQKYEGIILGNSHAKYGLPENAFFHRVINLANPSQDIYYNFLILKECLKEYKELFNNLKYVVIDLYDYNVFNIDTSRTKEILHYINWGGCCSPHNFEQNKNFTKTFQESLFDEFKMIKNEKIDQEMKELFGKNGTVMYVEDSIWINLSKENEKLQQVIDSKSLINRHKDTIKENIVLLEESIRLIKDFKPECEIIFTLLPRFLSMEEEMSMRIKPWKKEFDIVIKSLIEKYRVYYLDYKNCHEISSNPEFYYDGGHLNRRGGLCMASILDGKIKEILKSRKPNNDLN